MCYFSNVFYIYLDAQFSSLNKDLLTERKDLESSHADTTSLLIYLLLQESCVRAKQILIGS